MNETLEYAIIYDGYAPTDVEIEKMAKELWNIKHAVKK